MAIKKRLLFFLILMIAILPGVAAWQNASYPNRMLINVSNIANGTAIIINGSGGFSIGGIKQLVWVKAEPDLYVYFNDSSAIVANNITQVAWENETGTMASNNATAVWSAYLNVYHLGDLQDSAAYNNDLVSTGATYTASGYVGGGYYFHKAAGDKLRSAANSGVVGSVPRVMMGIHAWDGVVPKQAHIYGLGTYPAGNKAFSMAVIEGATAYYGFSSIGGGDYTTTYQVVDKVWDYTLISYDGTWVRGWINGANAWTSTNAIDPMDAFNVRISGWEVAGEWFNGTVDEVRIMNNTNASPMLANYTWGNFQGFAGYGTLGAIESPEGEETDIYLTMNANNATGVSDQSGNGNDAVVNGAVWTGSGKYAGAYSFDGVTSSTRLNLSGYVAPSSMTMCAWINPAKLSASSSSGIFMDGKTNLFISSSTRYFIFTSDAATTTASSSPITANTNGWQHICVVRMANGTMSFYVNGTIAGTENQASGTIGTPTVPTYIGGNSLGNYPFNGTIDEFRVFNYQLSSAQVMTLYNKTYFKFDQPQQGKTFVIEPISSNLTLKVNMTLLPITDIDLAVSIVNCTEYYVAGTQSSAVFVYPPAQCMYNYSVVYTTVEQLGTTTFTASVNDSFGNNPGSSLSFKVAAMQDGLIADQVFSSLVNFTVTGYFGTGVDAVCTIAANETCLVEFLGECITPLWDSCDSATISDGETAVLNCTPSATNTEKQFGLWASCNESGSIFNTSSTTAWIDNIPPQFAESRFDLDGQSVRSRNITGQFNITDSNIFRVNITLDGSTIYQLENINATAWNYTLNREVASLAVGSHQFILHVWDAHTAAAISDYGVGKSLFSNQLSFITQSNEIKIKAKDEGITVINPWTAEKQLDRYTFEYSPDDIRAEKYTFEVETTQPIHIVTKPDQKWKTWLVSGNNWIDFYQESEPGNIPKLSQTAWNKVTVEITPPKDIATAEKIAFSSIGDLNHAQVAYTFYTYNVTVSYVLLADEGEYQSTTLEIQNGTTLNTYTAGFWLNGTSLFPWVAQNGTTMVLNSTFITPQWNVTLIVQNHWQLNYSGETTDIYFNQTNARAAIDDCSVYNVTALVFTIYHEDEPQVMLNGSLEFMVTYWLSNKSNSKVFSSTKNNSNTFTFCIENESRSYFMDLYAMDTVPEGFAHRYYIFNGTINGTPQTIYLYNFNYTSGVSELKLTMRDYFTNNYIQGLVVKLQRLYLGEGVWRTVQMDQTDDFGLAIFNVLDQLEDYRLIFMDNNNTVFKTTNTMKFSCADYLCQLTYQLDRSAGATASPDLDIDWSYTVATNSINVTWSDPLAGSSTVKTVIYKPTYTGTATICNATQTGASGVVNCPTSGYTGEAFLRITADDQVQLGEWISLNTSRLGDTPAGSEGAFLAAIIILTCAMFGLMSPAAGIIAMLIGMVGVYMLGIFTPLTMGIMVITTLFAIAIGWKVRD